MCLGLNVIARGVQGPYDSETAFHEPFVLYGFLAACTENVQLVTSVLVLPQRQAALVQSRQLRLRCCRTTGSASGRNRLEQSRIRRPWCSVWSKRCSSRRAGRVHEATVGRGRVFHLMASLQHGTCSIFPRPSAPIPVSFGGSAPAALARCAPTWRWLDSAWFSK